MSASEVFGPITTAPAVEAQFLDELETWLPTYLTEVEARAGLEPATLQRPRFWGSQVEPDLYPGEKLPAIIVIAPGTDSEPVREQGATYSAWFQVSVVALVQAADDRSARTLAGYYAAALRTCVLQRGSMDVFGAPAAWVGEELQGEPAGERNRTRAAAIVHFRVKINEVVDGWAGPHMPDAEPYGPISTVQEVFVDVEHDEG
jgi:hypothetical protein